jgi:signal transduction histidine kinase
MEYAQTALSLSLKYDYAIGEAYAYRNLSNLNTVNEIYFLGMNYIQSALNIFRNLNDSVGIANCYISLGHLYRRLHNDQDEIKHFELAFDIFSQMDIPSRTGIAAHNLGESYYNTGDFEKSENLTLFAIEINKSIKQTSVLSSCYKVMGLLELSKKNYDEAEKYLQNALKISKQLGKNSQKIATVESMINLADIYKINNQEELQISYLNLAAEFSKTYNLSSYLPIIYNEMILVNLEKNKLDKAKKYIIEYKIVSDSLSKSKLEDKTDLVNRLIYLHSLEKEKKHLEQTEILQKESIKRRNLLLILTIFSSILLVWFIIKIKRINNKTKITNQTLLDQNETIRNQNNRLEVLVSTKDKLFSIIAHDLRSPFNSILGFSDLLLEDMKELSTDQIAHRIGLINRTAKSTLHLLENLLSWAKHQTGQIRFSPENLKLNPLINEIIESLDSTAFIKNISIDYKPTHEIEVYADNNMLRTIIRNLIQNSIKFTPKMGKVEIFASKKTEGIEISVSDNGIGMSKDMIDNLFLIGKINPKSGTANEKGSGLGLVLCKEFIEKHGSKISVKSQENLGSTFSFTIP